MGICFGSRKLDDNLQGVPTISQMNEKTYKVVITGDAGTGKTSLIIRYLSDQFSISYLSTIGVDFRIKSFVRKNKKIKLRLWDTAGQERFKSIIGSYYKGADLVLICFDVTNPISFDSISYYLKEVEDNAHPTPTICLVATKTDKISERKIRTHRALELAEKHSLIYAETSSKEGLNINYPFESFLDGSPTF